MIASRPRYHVRTRATGLPPRPSVPTPFVVEVEQREGAENKQEGVKSQVREREREYWVDVGCPFAARFSREGKPHRANNRVLERGEIRSFGERRVSPT